MMMRRTLVFRKPPMTGSVHLPAAIEIVRLRSSIISRKWSARCERTFYAIGAGNPDFPDADA
jgi:hypothetical protein